MAARIIDGKAIAEQIKKEIAQEAETLKQKGITPGLGFILVGNDPASKAYVRMKGKACDRVGFYTVTNRLPEDITQNDLLNQIENLNTDDNIHGFLVQHPLPKDIDENIIVEAVSADKDVDCFHPYNVGKLPEGREAFAPCTPAGIIELLLRSGFDPCGKHVVIAGRSAIVGRPLATLLSRKGRGGDATVTLVHSKTENIEEFIKQADIIIAAVGKPEFITGAMIKPGAVVIDVGINRVTAPINKEGKDYRIVGDVHFPSAAEVASAITPVPGGVGPMTIAMLLKNTLTAAKRKIGMPQ